MSKSVLVNTDKVFRATETVALITGKQPIRTEEEKERAAHFQKILSDAKIDVKDTETAVQFIYEKLGGLVRTETEQKEADKKKKEITAKKKNVQ